MFSPKLQKFWRLYYKRSYRIIAFFISTLLMVLSFPSAGRFSFDYELMRPWRYENVIAPYDFPILKTAEDLKAERDSIQQLVLPFFLRDSVAEGELRTNVNAVLRNSSAKLKVGCPMGVTVDSLKTILRPIIYRHLSEAYKRGILDLSEASDHLERSQGELVVVFGNIAEHEQFADLFNQRDAYSYLVSAISSDLKKSLGTDSRTARTIVEKLDISEVVIPNLRFDEGKTLAATQERMGAISLSSGMVIAGQRVIGTGDIVDKRTANVLESLKQASESMHGFQGHELFMFVGRFVMVGGLMFTLFLFLYYFRKDYYRTLHVINLILLLMTFLVCTTGLLANVGANISFIVPYVVLPIMLRIFTDSRLAIYVNTVVVLIISFFAFNSQLFIFLHIPAGLVACICLYHLNKRSQVVRTAGYMLLYYSVMYTGYMMWQQADFNPDTTVYVYFAISSALLLMVYPLIYIAEKIFGFISDVTLLELSDVNNKLLRELSEKCPGTFQHSLQVGNLGQEVAYKIGGNPMLVRVGALYHDIGKIVNPMYFTENQVGGVNPHDELPYETSAQVIIRHVKDGVELAKRNNIPAIIRDIIACHHGQSLVRYFYIAWCNEHPQDDPDDSVFTYEGPIPQTKEQAIIMMADAVEAGSKSLANYTDESIESIVDKVVDIQVNGHQFVKAPVTFADIEVAKQVFKDKLKSIYHARIQYPDKEE